MNVLEFLLYLQSLDIKISTTGEQLHVNGPKGALTPELRTELANHKAKILAFLKQTRSTPSSISPISRDRSLPLSFAQQRLWFLDQFEPGNPAYNLYLAFSLSGSLNQAVLQQSLNEVVRRHEALRTTFPLEDGQPVQLIAPTLSLPLHVVDMSHLPASDHDRVVRERLLQESDWKFDLARGPLLRATLLHQDDTEHTLILVMHHIITDGWSIGILLQELASLYNSFSTNQPPALPELPIQYADFAAWQRSQIESDRLQSQLVYWRRQLGSSPAVLQLPSDHPRDTEQSYTGALQTVRFSQSLTRSLKTLSHQEQSTLFMTLLAAFKLLLYRYTNDTDIIVGTAVANRNHVEVEGLIGYFVNMLALRTNLSGSLTFRQLLSRVRTVALDAFSNQDLPIEKLIEELQLQRNLNYNPLFQVMFVFQNFPTQSLTLNALTLNQLYLDRHTATLDLSFYLSDTQDGLNCTLEYNTDLFDASTIKRLLNHYQILLEGIVANPDHLILDLPLLSNRERQLLLVDWNDTHLPFCKSLCIHQRFEAQVLRSPEATAFIFNNSRLSYSELNIQANQLAHHLQSSGLKPGDIVGICIERSLDMVVGIMAILKAGGVYLPLDPTYPQQRLRFMLVDAQASLLLTQHKWSRLFLDIELTSICLDTEWDAIALHGQDNLDIPVLIRDPAYLIYTSGSTGTPKGVLALHQGTLNRLEWMWHTFPFQAGEICFQKTSLSFVDSVWEIFGPLLQGVPTVIIPDDLIKDVQRLVQTLAECHISRTVLVPSLLQAILNTGIDLQSTLPKLKYWITSGEAISVELAQRFLTAMPDVVFLNLYGSSEVSADATFFQIQPDLQRNSIPIGRPIANTQLYILDPHLQLVPIGLVGELYVGGDNLAQGYLNRPDLTRERFIPNPFSGAGRLYKTGDLARFLADGNVDYVGRIDHQVKIRGYRIELGEIEAVLAPHPDLLQTVVVARRDVSAEPYLVAYVVPRPQANPSVTNLRNFLKNKLPDYMLPSAFVLLDSLPLTPNGKLDRAALPVPDQARPELENRFVAPHTPLEKQLVDIWSGLLDVDNIGIHDDFFELGGHSLLVTQVISLLRSSFQLELPIRSFFEDPTVAGLVNMIETLRWATAGIDNRPDALYGELEHGEI